MSSVLSAAAQAHQVRVSPFLVEPDGAALRAITSIINQGGLSVNVQHDYPLAEVAAAHRAGETGHTRGKLVLTSTGE